ncbi:MAG: dUTP diphosphatase [Bacilli bacterium]|nr:dUTP diphosphatase [Bacilli bacterium]
MEKIRGFEVAKGWEDKNINLPVRKTLKSAGYDVEAAEDVVIPPFEKGCKPTLVHTGLKAYCQDDEWYMLANRSSHPGKKKLVLANGIGIIDADYYCNPDNDGEFMYAYYNIGTEPYEMKKGEVCGQVVFQKFLIADDDNATGERLAGFGSTD